MAPLRNFGFYANNRASVFLPLAAHTKRPLGTPSRLNEESSILFG